MALNPEQALAVRAARECPVGKVSLDLPMAHDSINAALCAIQEGGEVRSLPEVYTGQLSPRILAELVDLATIDQAKAA